MATTPNYGWVTPAPTDLVTDLPADFEVFADAVDADLAGLLGGTTGQVLVKNSGTDHDYDFATDPVSDIVTTAGDVLYGSAADTLARLGIGTAGQVLAVNGTADAPEWVTPVAPASGADWTLLNAGGTSLSGSTTTISGISDKDKIMMLVSGARTTSTSSPQIRVLLNGLTTNIYTHFWSQDAGPAAYATTSLTGNDGVAQARILLAFLSNNANSLYKGGITFTGCNSSGVKQFEYNGSASAGGGTGHTSQSGQGIVDTSATISSISLTTSAGTFDAGTIFVYASA